MTARPDLKRTIQALKALATTAKASNIVMSFSGQYNTIKEKSLRNTISSEEEWLRQNQLSEAISTYIDDLPSGLELFKNKLFYLVQEREEVPKVLDLLFNTVSIFQKSEIEAIQSAQDRYEDLLAFEKSQLDRQVLEEMEKLHKGMLSDLSEFTRNLHEAHLNSAWEEEFFQYLLEERSSFISEKQERILNAESSLYLEDILSLTERNGPERPKLLLWQEEFLTKNYPEAKKCIDEVRIDLNQGNALVYELSALTHLKYLSADKMIRQAVTAEDESAFRKLMLFIERTLTLGDFASSTKNESLKDIYEALLQSIKKYYENISYDYVINRATPGRSKKRELIKQCIDTSLIIHDQLSSIINTPHLVFIDLLLELEGGGKYQWIEPQSGRLKNKTAYPALEKREKIVAIVKSIQDAEETQSYTDFLYNSLAKKSRNLTAVKSTTKGRKRLTISCHLAYLLYGEERFNELKKKVNASKEGREYAEPTFPFEEEEESIDELKNEEAAYLEAVADIVSEEKQTQALPSVDDSGLRQPTGVSANDENSTSDTKVDTPCQVTPPKVQALYLSRKTSLYLGIALSIMAFILYTSYFLDHLF